jgi:hypothetical protein
MAPAPAVVAPVPLRSARKLAHDRRHLDRRFH